MKKITKSELRQICKEEIDTIFGQKSVGEQKVTNKEILDLVDNIQSMILKLKNQDKTKASKLFTLSTPFIKELYKFLVIFGDEGWDLETELNKLK